MQIVIKSFTSGEKQVSQQQKRFLSPYYSYAALLLGVLFFCTAVSNANSSPAGASASTITTDGTKAWNLTTLDRLRVQLFTNYDKNSHPTCRGVPTNISLGLSVNYIDIDEMNGKMTLHSWLKISWKDDNRSWNPRDYDNITQMHMKMKEVWKPDITLFNSAGEGGEYIGDTQIMLANDGSFLWVPPVVYTAYCNLNLQLWPYDTQTCKLKVGSWTLTYIDIAGKDSLDYNELVQSTEWEITGSQEQYYEKDYYNYVEYTIHMRRRSTMYAAVIFTPASCIIMLSLSMFWLPPQMGEKILLNGIVIVVIAAFLMYFAQLLPILAANTPLIVLFYSSSLLLLSISTIIAVVVLYLSTAKHKRRVPEFIKNLLNSHLGRVLLLTHFTLEAEPQSLLNNGTKELGEPIYNSADNDISDPLSINPTSSPSNRSIQFDWVLLATAVDRICFICYCIIFLVLAIVFYV